MSGRDELDLMDIAERSVEHLKKKGAKDSAVGIGRSRSVELEIREQKVEKLQESASAAMSVSVYADGRYSSHSTNDLRWSSVEAFLDKALVMTRLLQEDGFRQLPDPALYANRPTMELGMSDPFYGEVETAARKSFARAIEDAALSNETGARDKIQSVTTAFSDGWGEAIRITSNGFHGRTEHTSFMAYAECTVRDGEKRPEDYWYVASRKFSDIKDPAAIGTTAVARAMSRVGATKIPGGAMSVAVENRAAGRLLGFFLQGTTGAALQQKRSFLDGKLGKKVISEKLTITDDPLIPGALGSRHFDGEGISARKMPLIERGILRNYFIDTYYGRKLGMAPTTGGWSNLVIDPGDKDLAAMATGMKRGIVVTSFLGGNSNSLTGDFSVGIQGYLVENGKRIHPISEMNLSGNHGEFWSRLAEVGSDPWLNSSMRVPALLFEDVSVSGA